MKTSFVLFEITDYHLCKNTEDRSIHRLIDWLIDYCLTPCFRIYHQYWNLTTAGEWLPLLVACLFEQRRSFIVPHTLFSTVQPSRLLQQASQGYWECFKKPWLYEMKSIWRNLMRINETLSWATHQSDSQTIVHYMSIMGDPDFLSAHQKPITSIWCPVGVVR